MGSDNPSDYGLTLPIVMTIAAFTAIAWVNTIELQGRIWYRFKRYTGLYFWSLLVSSWGCALHPLAFLMLDFRLWPNPQVTGIVIGISWWAMVTGQALVLYSRLYLVVRDRRKIRWVLVMIITNVFILHIPITIVSQMAYSEVSNAAKWMRVYNVYEKVQMTGFTIQEAIISGIYLWETKRILGPGKTFQRAKTREVMWHLIWVNVFIIFLDIALLATEYANLFTIQTVFKAAIYSLKLRFEFVVLNQLMKYVQTRASTFEPSGDTPSQLNATSRSRGIPIPLESVKRHTMRSGDRPTDGRASSMHNYSVSASKGAPSPLGVRSMDGVLRTTEVRVIHSDTDIQEEQDIHDTRQQGMYHATTTNTPQDGHGEAITVAGEERRNRGAEGSPTSSIVEFAGKGVGFAGKAV